MADLETVEHKLDMLLERGTAAPRFLAVKEAASYAGVSADSVRRMLASGELTALRPVPGRIVVDRHQLDAVILATADRKPPNDE